MFSVLRTSCLGIVGFLEPLAPCRIQVLKPVFSGSKNQPFQVQKTSRFRFYKNQSFQVPTTTWAVSLGVRNLGSNLVDLGF